jgi:hypothetical protein
MPEDGIQRRRHPRYPCNVAVTVYLDSAIIQTRIPQISRGGCLIFPPLPAHKSPEIKLSLTLEDGLPSVNCKGEIVYTINDRGSGVAFTEISIYNQDRITSFFANQPSAEKPSGNQ